MQEKRRKSEVLLPKFAENPKYHFRNSSKNGSVSILLTFLLACFHRQFFILPRLLPPLLIIILHIAVHAVVRQIVLRSRIEAPHIVIVARLVLFSRRSLHLFRPDRSDGLLRFPLNRRVRRRPLHARLEVHHSPPCLWRLAATRQQEQTRNHYRQRLSHTLIIYK